MTKCTSEQLVEFWSVLDQSTYLISKARDMELRTYSLSFIQGKVLLSLKILDNEPTIGELSQWLFREHCSISGITDRMVKKQLLKKYQDPVKGNLTRIALTASGEKAYESIVKRQSLLNIFSVLTREECQELREILKITLDRALQLANFEYNPDIKQTIMSWVLNFFLENEAKMVNLPDIPPARINRNQALLDIINSYCPPEQLFTWMYMDHTAHAITRVREKELEKYGLSIIQSKILDILSTLKKPPAVGELAKLINRDHNSISGITDRMCKKGLLQKYRDPLKRHLTRVALTQKGKQSYRTLVDRQSIVDILSFMPNENCHRCMHYLRMLLERAKREIGS